MKLPKTKKDLQLRTKKKMKTQNVRINKELRDIIHGYIMSDGYITITNCLQVEQGSKQAKFVEWMYNRLRSLCTDKGISRYTRTDRRTGKTGEVVRFYTKALMCGFNSMWYKQIPDLTTGTTVRRKTLPKSLPCFFTPTFVTLWFAGDGTKELGEKAAKFEVTAFTPKERLLLKGLFQKKFGIQTTIIKNGTSSTGTQQYALRVPAPSYEKFRKLITEIDLIPTVFPYKLHKI